MGFKGKVKSCLERIYKADKRFGKWENGDIEDYGHHRTKFDKNGYYTEIEYIDDEGELIAKTLPTREKEKIIEEITYDEHGKVEIIEKISFISNNEIEIETFDKNGNKLRVGKMYRSNNKNTKAIFTQYIDGKPAMGHTTTWEYDKNGNIISQKITDKKGQILSYQKYEYIEFDKQNNWIKRLVYNEDDDNPENIIIRELEYY